MPAHDDLFASRGAAVLGFCARVCRPLAVTEAAAHAFHLAVARGGEAIPSDDVLLEATRLAAADHAPVDTAMCREACRLLARRASGDLPADGAARLAEHLRACPSCRSIEQRLDEAEQVFRAMPFGGAPPAVRAAALADDIRRPTTAPPAGLFAGPRNGAEPRPAATDRASRWLPPDGSPKDEPAQAAHAPAPPVSPSPAASPWLSPPPLGEASASSPETSPAAIPSMPPEPPHLESASAVASPRSARRRRWRLLRRG